MQRRVFVALPNPNYRLYKITTAIWAQKYAFSLPQFLLTDIPPNLIALAISMLLLFILPPHFFAWSCANL
jgi:hypothetical protein